jgi:hypothetical protein
MDVLRHPQLDTRVPARPVQYQHNLFGGTGADRLGERRQLHLKEGDADRRGQMKDGATRGRMDKADQLAPLEAMLDRSERALAVKAPDLVQEWLEADAMLVDRPDFDLGVRKRGRSLPQQGA